MNGIGNISYLKYASSKSRETIVLGGYIIVLSKIMGKNWKKESTSLHICY